MSALAFLLPGCEIDSVRVGACKLIISAHSFKEAAVCPECALSSQRVYSYYTRKPRDLPIVGLVVRLSLRVRRFRCLNPACKKRTFAEDLPELLAPHAQRTNRLTVALYHIGQSLGGAAGSRLLKHLFMPASGDTLLRILHRRNRDEQPSPRILGIDDWAIRKGRNYGTILVDLERHQVIDLLPDRTAETLATWLSTHPEIEVIARDRSIEYARGIAEGAPQALQVADRWHLLLNLRQMLEHLLSRLHSRLKRLPLPEELQPDDFPTSNHMQFPRTSAEQQASQASRARRMALYEEVQRQRANQNIKQIAEQMGLSRGTVRIYYYAEAFPERGQHERNPNKLDLFLPYLERRYMEGCQNAMQLWREIRALGYPRSHRRIYQWMNQRRKQSGGHEASRTVDNAPVQKSELDTRLPSVKQLAWLIIRAVESLSEKERVTLWQICQDPTIEKVYTLTQEFAIMVRQGIAAMLDPWLIACQDSGVTNLQTFADGVKRDYDAIRGALETNWSNGQTEGQVNRLKMLKRQMYGRDGLDLLQTRVLYSSTEH